MNGLREYVLIFLEVLHEYSALLHAMIMISKKIIDDVISTWLDSFLINIFLLPVEMRPFGLGKSLWLEVWLNWCGNMPPCIIFVCMCVLLEHWVYVVYSYRLHVAEATHKPIHYQFWHYPLKKEMVLISGSGWVLSSCSTLCYSLMLSQAHMLVRYGMMKAIWLYVFLSFVHWVRPKKQTVLSFCCFLRGIRTWRAIQG
jgi:hypothetical protein